MTQAQDEHREQPPTFGILAVPELRPGDYLATLHEWGALPEVIPVIEAAWLLATLCKQNPAALRKIIMDAIGADDIRFWGLSHSGEWREGMFRILHKPIGKPKIRPETNSRTAAVTLQFKTHGPLHVEAMGINPADVVKLLERRGRKVPHELLTLIQPAPAQATATPAPAESASDGPATAVPNWKMRVQTEATELFIRLLASGANPTPHSILDSMVTWCCNNEIKTDGKNGGINPSKGYLRTHVLGGRHWTPPTMSREQAKKHIAQVAQVAQTKVAQVAQQHT